MREFKNCPRCGAPMLTAWDVHTCPRCGHEDYSDIGERMIGNGVKPLVARYAGKSAHLAETTIDIGIRRRMWAVEWALSCPFCGEDMRPWVGGSGNRRKRKNEQSDGYSCPQRHSIRVSEIDERHGSRIVWE